MKTFLVLICNKIYSKFKTDAIPTERPTVVQFSLESLEDNEYYGFAPREEDIKVFQIWDYINVGMANKCEYFNREFAVSVRLIT